VRQAELKIAVDQLRAQKAERQRRRERWQHFKAQRAQSNSVVITSDVSAESQPLASYQSWDAWEPSESDSETAGPAFDTNQPALREMEKDIEERNKAAAERKANADKLKDQGNAAFAKGEISYAIRLYSDAIDLKRDQKAYYCNRALAYLKLRFVCCFLNFFFK
jgi:tetratricopeptide (TPR) repeat protein